MYRLDDHRDRRQQRFETARALNGADAPRRALVAQLGELVRQVSADRAAVVWVDEYGPGLVHPHVVVDVLSDRPRRTFSEDLLRASWDGGVPGVYEVSAPPSDSRSPWSLSIALGSDGTRAWFVTVDAISPRPTLRSDVREGALFLAGECSSLVLHRDLRGDRSASDALSETGFAGAGILKDLDGRDSDSDEGRQIALRFVVGRLPRLLLDDDLAAEPDRLRSQSLRAREEVMAGQASGGASVGREAGHWYSVLDAYGAGDLSALAQRLLQWGSSVEGWGHSHGAVEIYRAASDVATAVADVDVAVEAARWSGRCLRRLSRWEEARDRYDLARDIAECCGMPGRLALVCDGLATIHRERGNLPKAREVLTRGLETAIKSGDRDVVGRLHHGFMGLEHNAGNLGDATHHGLEAVRAYSTNVDRIRGLAGLAGVLQDQGDLGGAEDAWTIVSASTDEPYYRMYAADALSHIAARRGDAATFARRAAEADALGWESGADTVKAEILLYRGLSYAALQRSDAARVWLKMAVDFAHEHNFSRTLFRAEEALEALDQDRAVPSRPATSTTVEVGTELRVLRRELVGTPA